MQELFDRIWVVLKAAPTWLIAASTVFAIFADEIPGLDPYIAPIVAAIATAITIIRRVTPVLPHQRGLLPNSGTHINQRANTGIVDGVRLFSRENVRRWYNENGK